MIDKVSFTDDCEDEVSFEVNDDLDDLTVLVGVGDIFVNVPIDSFREMTAFVLNRFNEEEKV